MLSDIHSELHSGFPVIELYRGNHKFDACSGYWIINTTDNLDIHALPAKSCVYYNPIYVTYKWAYQMKHWNQNLI